MLKPDMLTKKYMEIYSNAAHMVEVFRQDKGTDIDWPEWCYLPVAASYAIISEVCEDMRIASPDIGNLAAILNWRPTKGVYRFDPELLESLWNVDLDRGLPVDLFFQRLPAWCCYIDLEGFPPAEDRGLYGFFIYLESDANSGTREIRLTMVFHLDDPAPQMMTIPFHADAGQAVGDMLKGAVDYTLAHSPWAKSPSGANLEEEAHLYYPLFSLGLYLCSVERDIMGPPKQRKVRKTKNPKKQKRQLSVEYRVGSAIGSAIRWARATGGGTGTGTKKSPHIRSRAHYHLYWTGKGRSVPSVKFIPPVPVGQPLCCPFCF